MDVTLPDGTTIQGVPDGTTKAQLAEKLKGKGMNVPDDWMKPAAQARPQAPRNLSTDNPVTQAVGESALQMGSGLAASAVGGVRGLYDLASGQGAGKASADIESTQEALTYQPRSAAGKAASKAVGAPFRWLAGKGDQAGQMVADVSRPVIGEKASAALGAGVNTAVQSAPAALVPGARGLSRMVRGGEAAAIEPRGYQGYVEARDQGYEAYQNEVRAASEARQAGHITTEQETERAHRAYAQYEATRTKAHQDHIRTPEDHAQAVSDFPPGSAPGAPGPGVSRGTSAQAQPQGAPQTPPLSASGAPRGPVTDPSMAPPGPPQAPGAPQPPLAASGAPRAPMTEPPGAMPPRDAQNAPGAQTGTPEGRAQGYAGRIGLDWARLGAGTRRALTTIAQDASALERLDPAAVKRKAHLESQRIPMQATRGQLTRDTVQLRREAIASNTTEGAPIGEMDVAANRDLQANLEVLRGRAAGRRSRDLSDPLNEEGEERPGLIRSSTKRPTEVGDSIQGAASGKEKWSRRRYDAAYKVARETEPDARASLAPVTALLTENPDIQHLGWVQSWLNKAARAKGGPEGEPVAMTDATLNELDDLRKLANKNIAAGGTDGHYAGQLKKAIDTAMQDVPEAAKAWKRATDLYREHQVEFKDQSAVRALVSKKRGSSDRAMALEDTAQKIATGKLEQIRQVKKTLLKGEDRASRVRGAKAWADLRGELVNRILEDARNVTSADVHERAILTEVALRKSIKRYPRENLEEILGKGAVKELMSIVRAARITTRSPVGGRTTQSGTVPNALNLAEAATKHIVPGLKYVHAAKRAGTAVRDFVNRGRDVQQALISPLEQAARDVERSSVGRERRRREQYQAIEGQGPTLPPDSIGAVIPPGPQQP